MDDFSEKRGHTRHEVNLPVQCLFLNRGYMGNAHLSNCGEGGVCMRASSPLLQGRVFCLKLDYSGVGPVGTSFKPGLRSVAMAEVKWCRPDDSEKPGSFTIGARYL